MTFDELYISLLREAENDAPPPPLEDDEDENAAPEVEGGDGDDSAPDIEGLEGMEGMEDEMPVEEEETVNPEEIELAKVAVRALYFNIDSKDVHQFKLKIKDKIIPFEKIPDFFESSKRWKPVVAFVEHLMDKFEGTASRWAEEKEISGKPIIQKIALLNNHVSEEEQLDDAKRLYWVRIILNCMLYGKPTENMSIGDVTERNLKEVFSWLKLHYGMDTRGLAAGKDYRAPGVF